MIVNHLIVGYTIQNNNKTNCASEGYTLTFVGYTIQNNDKTNCFSLPCISGFSWIYHSKQ